MAASSRLAGIFRGLMKGLGSPAFMFGGGDYIEPAKIEVEKLHRSIADPTEAMASDWERVGSDLQAAIESILPPASNSR